MEKELNRYEDDYYKSFSKRWNIACQRIKDYENRVLNKPPRTCIRISSHSVIFIPPTRNYE